MATANNKDYRGHNIFLILAPSKDLLESRPEARERAVEHAGYSGVVHDFQD